MAGEINGNKASYAAGGAIAKHILVYFSSGSLAVAGLATEPIGSIDEAAFAAGEVRAVSLRSGSGSIRCVAAGAFSQGAVVYGRALGKVDDVSTSSAVRIGIALAAATAAGDIVPVMPC